jgi:hypothetical protein
MRLEDYLDGVRGTDPGVPVGARAQGFGTMPMILRPFPLTPALIEHVRSAFAPLFSARDRAATDAQMWALDQGWASSRESSQWVSMKTCSRVVEVGQPPRTESWYSATVQANGCRNWEPGHGTNVQPVCNWGYWRLFNCTLEAASKYQFQVARYIWAQDRMRLLLASKPQPGVTSAEDAAAWVWKGSQLISALLWATNIRFNNPDSNRVANYGAPWSPPAIPADTYDGPTTAYDRLPFGEGGFPGVRVLNTLPLSDLDRPPPTPTRQNDFSPGTGPQSWVATTPVSDDRAQFAIATPSGPAPYTRPTPIGMSDEQVADLRRMAFANYSSGDADAIRWASNKAMTDWWFRATWNWDTYWRPVADVHTRTSRWVSEEWKGPGGGHRELGWSARPVTLVAASARWGVEKMGQLLEHYSDPTLDYNKWLADAMSAYARETGNVGASQAAQDFRTSSEALNSQIQSATMAISNQSTAAWTSAPTQATLAIVSIVLNFIPIYGQLIAGLLQGLNAFLSWLFTSGVGAIGNTPCSALPFIRIIAPRDGAPPCDLTADTVIASALGVSSRATWPVSVGGQWVGFAVDGQSFRVDFESTDTTADLVARRINARAALVGLPRPGPTGTNTPVATINTEGQVHVQGADASQPARVTGGNAAALGFPNVTAAPPPPAHAPPPPPPHAPPPLVALHPPAAGGSGAPLAIGAGVLIALRLLLG